MEIKEEVLKSKKEQLLNIKQFFKGRFIHEEVISNCLFLDELKKDKAILNYLELGVHNGASFCLAISNDKNINCYGIDRNLSPELKENIENSNKFNNNFKLFQGNTDEKSSIDFAKSLGPIDLLFIDAGHTYDDVKKDFTNYSPLVKSKGYIIFDDYTQTHPGVISFCDEINEEHFKKIGVYNLTDDKNNCTHVIQKI